MMICSSCGREFEASSDTESLCPQCSAEVLSAKPGEAAPGRLQLLFESPTIVLIALNTLVYLIMAWQTRSFLNFDLGLLLNWGANAGRTDQPEANGGGCSHPPLSMADCCTSR